MPAYAQLVIGPAGSGKVWKRDGRKKKARRGQQVGGGGGCGCAPHPPPSSLALTPALFPHFPQSTYCETIREHCATIGRSVHVVNLGDSWAWLLRLSFLGPSPPALAFAHTAPLSPHSDPAAEDCLYPVAFDVRDLITVEDAMEELGLGPNG